VALFNAQDNCWEGTGPGAQTCMTACTCVGTPAEGGAPEGGMDAAAPDAADAGGGD
jgi:hypothetical protein